MSQMRLNNIMIIYLTLKGSSVNCIMYEQICKSEWAYSRLEVFGIF